MCSTQFGSETGEQPPTPTLHDWQIFIFFFSVENAMRFIAHRLSTRRENPGELFLHAAEKLFDFYYVAILIAALRSDERLSINICLLFITLCERTS